jgi:hypothetical protein
MPKGGSGAVLPFFESSVSDEFAVDATVASKVDLFKEDPV